MYARRLYLLLLILGTSFWGISFSLVKVGVSDGSPFVFLAYKFIIAAFVLSLFFIRRMRYIGMRVIIVGVIIGVPLLFGNVFQTIGLQNTTVTNSAFITGLDVLLIPLFKWGLFRKSVPSRVWISCSVAISGLYLIVAQNGLSPSVGDIWTMACAVFFACYVLAVGYFANKMDAMLTVIVAMTVCGLGCLTAALFDERANWLPTDPNFWHGVVFAGLFATAFMYAIQSAAQRHLEEEKVALTYLCEPVFAAVAGVVLLGEALTFRTWIGAGFILLALVIAEVGFWPRKKGLRSKEENRDTVFIPEKPTQLP